MKMAEDGGQPVSVQLCAEPLDLAGEEVAVVDDAGIKEGIRWMWSLGDYGAIAAHLEPHAIELAQRSRLQAGSEVLDVAAGNGNFAIAAARLGATVVATDLAPSMVDLGRRRTSALGLAVEWREADAEQLPFPDERFDVVASVFGAMFAPDPERVATEMFRVTKRGGLVAMANYGPKGFLGRITALLAERAAAPPPGMHSPFEWGVTDEVHRRFKGLTSSIEIYPQALTFEFESLDAGWDFWERANPPIRAILSALDAEQTASLREDGRKLMTELNQVSGGGLTLESDYLQVLARKA
jgi:ubiquinone/menaquinone biosynthesis C-methylase UbiE